MSLSGGSRIGSYDIVGLLGNHRHGGDDSVRPSQQRAPDMRGAAGRVHIGAASVDDDQALAPTCASRLRTDKRKRTCTDPRQSPRTDHALAASHPTCDSCLAPTSVAVLAPTCASRLRTDKRKRTCTDRVSPLAPTSVRGSSDRPDRRHVYLSPEDSACAPYRSSIRLWHRVSRCALHLHRLHWGAGARATSDDRTRCASGCGATRRTRWIAGHGKRMGHVPGAVLWLSPQ